jgi:hypothetical protein
MVQGNTVLMDIIIDSEKSHDYFGIDSEKVKAILEEKV